MQQPFTAAPHHDVLVLLVQMAILLLTARAFGELALRLGQPSVVGEILAGITLGPSLLSGFVPLVEAWMIPHTQVQGYLLEVASLFGAMFLLLITGLETDIALIRRHARTAVGVSIGGISVTFLSGFLLGQFLPDSLLANPAQRLVFALFVATAMAISAIPVIAKVLIELNLIRRDIGQTILAAGMSDDTIGWILLSIVAGLTSGKGVTAGSVFQSVVSVLGFMLFSFTVGRWMVKHMLDFVQNEIKSRDAILSLVVILAFAWGALSHALHLEAVLGAFVMGILFSQMRSLPQDTIHKLESIALGIFAPIFFGVAGLKVDITRLFNPGLFALALLVIFVATAGKVVGTYIGARRIGKRDHWTALSFGAALNARGAMEIIIATIGLSLGILTQDMFSIIVLMAMATSLMTPTALRWVFKHVTPEEQELKRLQHEELIKDNLMAHVHRVLLPVKCRDNMHDGTAQAIEARILERLSGKTGLAITLFTVSENGDRARSSEYLTKLGQLFPHQELAKKVVVGSTPLNAILDEAKKDYDLLLLGATEELPDSDGMYKHTTSLFTPLVDCLVRMSPCPSIVVRGTPLPANWDLRRILVPTNGSVGSRRAAEVGFALSQGGDEEVFILKVIQHGENGHVLDTDDEMLNRQLGISHQIVDELRSMGESLDVRTVGEVRIGSSPETVILEVAKSNQMDLIILGTSLRVGSDRLYLGPRVERILKHALCPVIIVNA